MNLVSTFPFQYRNDYLNQLPNEIKTIIVLKSNFEAIKALKCLNIFWMQFLDQSIPEIFAKAIGIKNSSLTIVLCIKIFHRIFDNSEVISTNDGFEKVCKTFKYCKANSILKVWLNLARMINDQKFIDFYEKTQISFDETIKKAEDFEDWCKEKEDSLLKITYFYEMGHSLTYLPPQIGYLTNLTSLDLRHNSLIFIPPEIGKLKELSLLCLGSNSLISLPPEIKQLTKITCLDIYGNLAY